MNITFYPKHDGTGYTPDEINRKIMWLYADVKCPHCGKEQSVAQTGSVGGPCILCGRRTDGL